MYFNIGRHTSIQLLRYVFDIYIKQINIRHAIYDIRHMSYNECVYRTLYDIHCTLNDVQCTSYSVHFIVYSVLCTMYTIHVL